LRGSSNIVEWGVGIADWVDQALPVQGPKSEIDSNIVEWGVGIADWVGQVLPVQGPKSEIDSNIVDCPKDPFGGE